MKKRFILTLIVSMIVFTAMYVVVWDKVFDKNTIAASEEDIMIEDEHLKDPKLVKEDEILFLMMGVDSPDVKKSKGTRTDTMMLSKVNFKTGKIDILSLPRDSRVMVNGKKDKLNHAHAYGGTPLTINTVRDFLNIDLNYYVKVDYKAVKSIVDAIGGVEINVPMRMYYQDPMADPPLNIDLQPGVQVLNGQKANGFLRFRSGYKDGDLGRIKAQQYFLEELIKQTLKPKNIPKLPKIVKSYFDYVDTNIPMSLILKGVGLANNLDSENISMYTLSGEQKRISGLSYLIPDVIETEKLVKSLFSDYLLD